MIQRLGYKTTVCVWVLISLRPVLSIQSRAIRAPEWHRESTFRECCWTGTHIHYIQWNTTQTVTLARWEYLCIYNARTKKPSTAVCEPDPRQRGRVSSWWFWLSRFPDILTDVILLSLCPLGARFTVSMSIPQTAHSWSPYIYIYIILHFISDLICVHKINI